MSDFHCLEIEFPNVDFSTYGYPHKVEVSKVHHAHLYTKKNEIELKIFYDDQTYFGEKLMYWSRDIDWQKFGSFIKVKATDNHTNERIKKIDISESKLLDIKNSTNYYYNDKKYIKIRIDTVRFYWNPDQDLDYSAEFYLDDNGFRVIEPFYGILYPKTFLKNDGKFEIRRMKGSTKFYSLAKSMFRPEYNFVSKDDHKERSATVTKEPKIQFKYKKGITEKEAIFYGDVVLLLASFYHHVKIDYILRRIYLPENTITIINNEEKTFVDTNRNLFEFEINWNFNEFLQASWQKEALKNYTLLSKAITLFNQSHIVDSYSSFLIRFNIIEICNKQKKDKDKFTFVLNKKQVKKKQEEALEKLLEAIEPKEHEEFKKRWNDVQTSLSEKPMKKQLLLFLENQKLDPKIFPVKLDEIHKLRNSITHGSIDKVDVVQLRKANIMLYRISGILILNLMGIKDWKLKTTIN
jgi:hypothetical protein